MHLQRNSIRTVQARAGAILLLAGAMSSRAQADDLFVPPIVFDPLVSLEGRHPEVVARMEYKDWSNTNPVSAWRETQCAAERQNVILVGRDDDHLLAIEVADCRRALRGRVARVVPFDLTGSPDSRAKALEKFRALHGTFAQSPHVTVQPDVIFDAHGATLHWQVIADDDKARIEVDLLHGQQTSIRHYDLPQRLQTPPRLERTAPLDAEDLADDGLHHLKDFRAEAVAVAGAGVNAADKARRVYDFVRAKYRFNSFLQHVREFTLSDQLTNDIGRQGICDEFAVVQVTYLRALDVPSHMVFLTWLQGGVKTAHATVEFQDEQGTWHAMDALNGFDEPGVYAHRYGVKNVVAALPSHPNDARSNTPVNGEPDPPDDGMYNYYGDFELKRAPEGGTRPVYSN